MQKFKKYAKKCVSLVVMLAFVCSLFVVLCIPASAYSNLITSNHLSEFFKLQNSGSLHFYDVGVAADDEYKALWGEGYFEGTPGTGVGQYSVTGNFKNVYPWFSSEYYTISFPLSFCTDNINIQSVRLFLIDSNDQVYEFKRVNAIWPDQVAKQYDNHDYATYFFEASFSGALLVEMKAYRLTVQGNNWSGSGTFVGGLVRDRFVTVSSMSKAENDLIYGDPNTDYKQPSSEPQDKLHGLEDELINDDGLNNIGDFFSDSGNGGNSIVNISNGLQAAGVLFAELFNFNGKRYTIFNMLINFSLTLGMVCFLLNLAPKVFGGSSRSKDKGRKSNKGGNKK